MDLHSLQSFLLRACTAFCFAQTFNVPGLGCSYAVVHNAKLRKQLALVSRGIVTQNATLGYVGVEAAYSPEGARTHI